MFVLQIFRFFAVIFLEYKTFEKYEKNFVFYCHSMYSNYVGMH